MRQGNHRCLHPATKRSVSLVLMLLASACLYCPHSLRAARPIIPGAPAKELSEGLQKTIAQTTKKSTAAPTKKTKIKIKGLTAMSEEQALGLLGNRIGHVQDHLPSPSRADDAAFLLERILRNQGLPQAKVDWTIPKKKNRIVLTVTQGPSRHLGEVIVSGIDQALEKTLITYFKKQSIGFNLLSKGKVPYIPSLVEEAVDSAVIYLHSEGYWNAEVKLTNTIILADQGLVNLHITVHPGPLYRLAPSELRGPSPINLSRLRQQLSAYLELPANTKNIKAARKTTLSYFLDQGYAFAEIQMDKLLIGQHMRLIFIITAGNRYQIGKINIVGLERTDPQRLYRRIDKGTGSLYNPELIEAHRRKFMSTGAFSSFLIETQPRTDGTIDMTQRIQEGRARSVSSQLGVGSYEGGIFGLSYRDQNFRGKLQTLAISGEFSGLGPLGQASINDPMLFGTDLNGTLRTFLLSYDLEGYSKVEAGLGAELIWTINDHYSLRFFGNAITAQTSGDGLPDSELGYKDYNVASLGFSQRLDFRDSKINPHKGFYGELLTEVGTVTGGSAIPYFKTELRTSYRQPIKEADFLIITGRVGLNFNSNQSDYPIDLRFFLGGSDSVRSFPEREMGPSVNGDPVGGEAYWIASVEYNHKIKGPVYMNIFTDAGSLARDTGEFQTADVNYAAGLGFWLNLPIGPVRAEYGYNLNRRKGEPAGTFHFTIGVNF